MATMAFDSLRYTRRLREAGVPEPQAEAQAELMAEAFGFYAENILTRDHFTDVINVRFAGQDRTLSLHTWMLGLLLVVLVIPQLQAWLS